MEGCFTFKWEGGGAGVEGVIFKWGLHPMEGISFDGGSFRKKIVRWRGRPTCPATVGNSDVPVCLLLICIISISILFVSREELSLIDISKLFNVKQIPVVSI